MGDNGRNKKMFDFITFCPAFSQGKETECAEI